MAKYKVGDKVRIVSQRPDELTFVQSMCKYLGKVLTVKSVEEMPCGTIYELNEAAVSLPWIHHDWIFKEEWLAGLAEPQSLPTRGAWIEIAVFGAAGALRCVAPHTGSVD